MTDSATVSSPPTVLFLSIDPSLAVENVRAVCQPLLDQLLLELRNNPSLRVHLLFGGSVLDWFLLERPVFLRELAQFHRVGQVTLLQGVLYAPLLDEGRFEDHVRQAALYKQFWQELSLPVHGLALGRFRWEEKLPLLAQELGESYLVVQTPQSGVTIGAPHIFGGAGFSPRAQFSEEQSTEEIQCFVADERTPPDAVRSFLSARYGRLFTSPETKLTARLSPLGEEALRSPSRAVQFSEDYNLFRKRLAELQLELELTREETKHLSPEDPLAMRFAKAERFYLRAQAGELVLCQSARDLTTIVQVRQQSFDAIIRAQVEIDSARRPDVDPNLGWVRLEERGEKLSFIDTQLMRLIFNDALEIAEFDYKPRKANLSACLQPSLPSASLSLGPLPRSAADLARIHETPRKRSQLLRTHVTKRTLGLLSIRAQEVHSERSCLRELTFRAGIGAHLNNATTGFSVEYWIEDSEEVSSDLGACLEFHLLLPSALREGLFMKPLQCVGGIAPLLLPSKESSFVTSPEITGGIYGVRLIDSAHQFLLDLRSAKQLSAVGVTPTLSSSNGVAALSIRLFIEAGRIQSDSRSNTVFLSIE